MKSIACTAALLAILPSIVANAQTSTVTLYGRANVGFDNYEATGASTTTGFSGSCGSPAAPQPCDYKARNRVFDQGSRIGVRGVEDLGGGLRAIFQIESGVNIDTGTNLMQSGQVNGNTGFFAGRDSFVGLDSAWGRLTFGRQTWYIGNGTIEQTQANYLNIGLPYVNSSGNVGLVSGPGGRQSNNILYTTPILGGFNATLSYAPASEAVQIQAPGAPTTAATNRNLYFGGATVRWAGGPIAAQVDLGRRKNATATPVGFTPAGTFPLVSVSTGHMYQDGLKFAAGWAYMPRAQISVILSRVRNKNVAGLLPTAPAGTALLAGGGAWNVGDTLRQDTWMVNWEQVFGNIQALAQLGGTLNVKGSSRDLPNSGSLGWLVGARYLFSKRTSVYVSYTQIRNKANSFADYAAGSGYSSAVPVGVIHGGAAGDLRGGANGVGGNSSGADPRVIALGIMHNF